MVLIDVANKRQCTEHLRRGRQARQSHRRRKALGRALHQVNHIRNVLRRRARRGSAPTVRFAIPKMLRKHKLRLARAFFRA